MWLNCHTFYSLKYGTLSVEKLIQLALQNDAETLVISDINNSTGVLECIHYCKENNLNIKIIAGIEFRDKKGFNYLYTGIAKNNNGFSFLNDFLTQHNLTKTPLPCSPPQNENVYWVYQLKNAPVKLKENEFVGVGFSDFTKLIHYKHLTKKLVFFQGITFAKTEDFEIHKHLRAISFNTLISKLSELQHGNKNEFFVDKKTLYKKLEDNIFLLKNAESLVANCSFEFEFKNNKNKKNFTESDEGDKKLLETLTYDGALERYGTISPKLNTRIEHELKIINQMGFNAYFLITWDIINFSKNCGIYHVGRGSGANSIVAYCLKITDVDPIELDLYFERFLNPKRSAPPDFDIDFCWKDRDKIIDYIFTKYGPKHVALLGTITNFKDKSIIRELGKVFGLPKNQIESLVNMSNEKIALALKNNEFDDITTTIFKIGSELQSTPNYRSIHAGGIIISELPLSYYTALDIPPKGYPTVQWDMHLAEEIGFEKLDVLSQRGIGHINDAVTLVHKNKGIKLNIHALNSIKEDVKIKELLKKGDTIGCFYVESPAMRGLLKKLKCDNYLCLTAASSIIRPGVASSGMMKEYIKRHNNPTTFKYQHPIIEEQLKETFGVMIYQEDVLKIGHYYGGLDLADADMLRRLMSGKKRGKHHLQNIKQKFFNNCIQKGYNQKTSEEIWTQMESFAGFSFSKAHSASYATESFQSLYLKAYFPLEFIVAVINNFGGFYNSWVYIYEAKKLGGRVYLPCINKSENTSCLFEKEIYLGLIHIKNLDKNNIEKIINERNINGIYNSLEEFVLRTKITLQQLLVLIKSGACNVFNENKKNLYWESYFLLGKEIQKKEEGMLLFNEPKKVFKFPSLKNSTLENLYDEIETYGFPITKNFFSLIKTEYRGDLFSKDLLNHIGKTVRVMGNFVNERVVYTKHGDRMAFGTFLDVRGDFFDTIHFPIVYSKYKFEGIGIYLIKGNIKEDFGFATIEVEKMAKIKIINLEEGGG